jgi:small-conductance mechanosensitive channel
MDAGNFTVITALRAPRSPFLRRWILLLLFVLLALPLSAGAQTAPAPPPQASGASAPVSVDELERLVNTLQDDGQRARLVDELRGLIAAQRSIEAPPPAPTPATLLSDLSDRIDAISGELIAAAGVVVDAPLLIDWLERQATDPVKRGFWLQVASRLGIIFGFALFAEWVLRRILSRPRNSLSGATGDLLFVRLFLLLARAALDALPILAFAGVAYFVLVLPATGTHFGTAKVATTLIGAYVTARLIVAFVRIVLLPRRAAPVIHLTEETRSYLYLWIKRFVYWLVYGYAVTGSTWWLGVPGGIYSLLLRAVGLVLAILAVIFVLQNRVPVGDWLRGRAVPAGPAADDASGWLILRRRFGDIWHVLAITYIVGIYLVYALRVEGGFVFVLRATLISVVVLLAARFAVSLARKASRHGFAIGDDLKMKFPTLESRANRYLPILTMLAATLIYAFSFLAILQAWDIAAFAWFGTDFGRRLTSALLSTGVVILVALVVWEICSSAIERYLSATDGNGVMVARSARARTLLPLLRTTLLVVLMALVVLIVLSEIGVDIAPLLAGAGVVGLAIGFGSQALVKDVITGLFILIEDTMAVGDVVDVGKGHSGVVEAISIRTIRLRDGAGALHAVPFSEVTSVANLTKDYAYFVANIGLSYREDIDRVSAVLSEVAAGMRDDPLLRPSILAPLEIVGLDKMSEIGMVLQVRLKTLPLRQWAVGREFNRRMKQAFDEKGIEMPYAYKPNYLVEHEALLKQQELAAEQEPKEARA